MTDIALEQTIHEATTPRWQETGYETGTWHNVCASGELYRLLGVRALLGDQQIAIFRVGEKLYAIDAIDPFSEAAVLSRGIIGDLQEQLVVASPVYKHHFNLETGVCLEDETVTLRTFAVREENGRIEVCA